MTNQHDVALLRLAAQHIACPDVASAHDAVRLLTAVQGQDRGGAVTAIALRLASRNRADVEKAFNDGEIVRSWPMRGTLHVVAADDLSWMLGLTAKRTIVTTSARRDALGLDDETLARAHRLVEEGLQGGVSRSRAELLALLDSAVLTTAGGRGYHLLLHLSQLGVLCFGPVVDGEQLVVLSEEWIRNPRTLDREQALGEFAVRYFRGHGPATVKDFARWTNLVAADVKVAMGVARPQLEQIVVDGIDYLMHEHTPAALDDCRKRARGVFLLPGFDELILGYQDRTATMAVEFAERIVPGGNGVFKPTIVSDGRVVGTWAHAGRGAKRTIATVPFATFSAKVEAGIARAYAQLP
jgi:hypothetical protein